MYESSSCPVPLPTLGIVGLFNFSHCITGIEYITVILMCISNGNSKWIVDLNIKIKIVKLLENIADNSMVLIQAKFFFPSFSEI